MQRAIRCLITSCLITLFFISLAFPQESSMGHGPRMGKKKWRGEESCWRASELNLSQEQKKNLALIQETYFRETQLFRLQLLTKRIELRELLLNPTIKLESIRSKYAEMIEIQSKQEEKSIEYLIRVRNLLSPDQLKNWCPEEEFPVFRQMMLGPGPMGPRRFREE